MTKENKIKEFIGTTDCWCNDHKNDYTLTIGECPTCADEALNALEELIKERNFFKSILQGMELQNLDNIKNPEDGLEIGKFIKNKIEDLQTKYKNAVDSATYILQEADSKLCDCQNTLPCGSVCYWCRITSNAYIAKYVLKQRTNKGK